MIEIEQRKDEKAQNVFQFDPCLMKMMCNDIEAIFQDSYIYKHKDFQKQIKKHPKGYLKIESVLRRINSQDYLGGLDEYSRKIVVANALRLYSRNLYCNGMYIRRVFPFKNCIKDTRPLYIQNFPNHKRLQQLLNNVTKIYFIEYHDADGWAMAYVEDPCKVMELDKWKFKENDGNNIKYRQLMVQSHEECSHQFQLTNGARIYVQYMEKYSKDLRQLLEDRQDENKMIDENAKITKQRMYGRQEQERIYFKIQEQEKNLSNLDEQFKEEHSQQDEQDEDRYRYKFKKPKANQSIEPSLSFNQRLLSIMSKCQQNT